VRSFWVEAAAIAGGALFFAASFPNPLVPEGLPFFAWFAYAPVFLVLRRTGLGPSVLWGALYGWLSYSLFAPWLGSFHPWAGMGVSLFQLFCMALLFPVLRAALFFYPRRGYLVQWLLWLGFEYLRTLGFLGFPYGISGYSQWSFLPLIQIASIFGVWGVSALVVFPSAWLAGALEKKDFFRKERLPLLIWGGALGTALIFGIAVFPDYSGVPEAKIALIQQNGDPWREDNRRSLKTLVSLSEEALAASPGADLVVWPETAFVPRIYWNLRYRDNARSYPLVRELLDFLAPQEAPFLIGNDDARMELVSGGYWDRVDYNGALLFEGGEIKDVYRKMHLVPFAEYFPYEKIFPWVYQALLRSDTHFWKPGAEAVVFNTRGLRFSAPICFEDTFGYLSRDFARRGAELFVNLTNDAWAQSLSCQMQHLSMAVFRAVENRRSLVRAAASGQTCAVDPAGRILSMAAPFVPAFLNVSVPLLKIRTPYTLWGDLWGIFFLLSAAGLLLTGTIKAILDAIKTGRNI
jgi:apolipoprotein N-acyltransferase